MKRILTSIVLMTFLFSGLALGEWMEMDDLVEREGLYYRKFTTVPFTGRILGQGPSGKIKNGKKDGPWVDYHSNGQLSYKGTFKDGKKVGPWVFHHSNGQLSYKGTFKDGKEEGPWVFYRDDGQLYVKGTYKDGKKISED
jgi:hypothetical protein